MGHLIILLRHARRTLPTNIRPATFQPGTHPWRRRTAMESNLHVDSRCYRLQGIVCTAFLFGIRGKYHPNGLHDNSKQLLHATRTIRSPVLVVQFHRPLHYHRRRVELRLRANHVRRAEEVAVYLPARWVSNLPLRMLLLLYPQFLR